ncbi:MAG TPA: hypothetical protein VLA31_06265 [Burkholderiaceae bacterium]|nr:hypothetical protein [Burkholderiaceae bacterium]
MKLTQIDRQAMTLLRSPIEEALRVVGAQYGVDLKVGKGKYGHTNGTFTLEIGLPQGDGNVMDADAAAFRSGAIYFTLKAEWLFQTVTLNGMAYKIVGLKPRSQKYPVPLQNLRDGKRYKFGADAVRRAMEQTVAVPTGAAFYDSLQQEWVAR